MNDIAPLRAARITIDLALPEGFEVTQEVREALDDLVGVMIVQAEDGLYVGGHPEAHDPDDERVGEHLVDFSSAYLGQNVEIVDIDEASSASRQHRIDTGIHLTVGEAF